MGTILKLNAFYATPVETMQGETTTLESYSRQALLIGKRFSRHPEELATKDLPGFRRSFTNVQDDLLFLTEGLDPWPSPIHEREGQIA